MRHGFKVLVAVVMLLACGAVRAGEGREDAERNEEIARGLMKGIDALQALGGHEESVAKLKHLLQQVKQRQGGEAQQAETKAARHALECLGLATKVLAEAGRKDAAEVAEHGALALRMALDGRKDPEASEVRRSAPARAQQAEALLLAAELLAHKGKADPAETLARLGRSWQAKAGGAREHEGEEREEGAGEDEAREREALAERVEVLRIAMHGAREAERKEAIEILERAIHTGELLLAGRQDAEARAVYERTPPLPMLARVLHMCAGLWREFGHEKKAARVAALSEYYAARAQDQAEDEEDGDDDDGEDGEHEDHEREEFEEIHAQLRRLRAELEELRRALERK